MNLLGFSLFSTVITVMNNYLSYLKKLFFYLKLFPSKFSRVSFISTKWLLNKIQNNDKKFIRTKLTDIKIGGFYFMFYDKNGINKSSKSGIPAGVNYSSPKNTFFFTILTIYFFILAPTGKLYLFLWSPGVPLLQLNRCDLFLICTSERTTLFCEILSFRRRTKTN
jgi:hypothetical protein